MARESMEAIERLFRRFERDLGPLAEKAKLALVVELGSMRLTVPSLQTLEREQRNQRVCLEFKGNNIPELSERYSMSQRCIRKVLSAQRQCVQNV